MREAKGGRSGKTKVKPDRATARASRKDGRASRRDLEKRLAEGLEREKATGEILRAISQSQTDVRPGCATPGTP